MEKPRTHSPKWGLIPWQRSSAPGSDPRLCQPPCGLPPGAWDQGGAVGRDGALCLWVEPRICGCPPRTRTTACPVRPKALPSEPVGRTVWGHGVHLGSPPGPGVPPPPPGSCQV